MSNNNFIGVFKELKRHIGRKKPKRSVLSGFYEMNENEQKLIENILRETWSRKTEEDLIEENEQETTWID